MNSENLWFENEIRKPHQVARISRVISNIDYLQGIHAVLNRGDAKFKGREYVTKKLILNYAKTIIKFHATYLLGKPVIIDNKTIADIYRIGNYDTVNYNILSNVLKFADAFEVVYFKDGQIKSKVLDSSCSYPVYDDFGNYIAFIEHWTDIDSNITYYNVYKDNYVEHWDNEGGTLALRKTDYSIGLPIHYHNTNDADVNFGESMLKDIKPLLDEIEDIMSKCSDSIYTLVLNPMPVCAGQTLESGLDADATGYVLNLEIGSTFDYANCEMDYNSIKLYLDNLKEMLNEISCVPSILSSQTVANVSSVAMEILFHMANILAMDNMKWLNMGFTERHKQMFKILQMQGVQCDSNINVSYNISMPNDNAELVNNLKTLQEMGVLDADQIKQRVETM